MPKDDFFDDTRSTKVNLKVSTDNGKTWSTCQVNMSSLEESGLAAGMIFQWQGEKYSVVSNDGELAVEKIQRPGSVKVVTAAGKPGKKKGR